MSAADDGEVFVVDARLERPLDGLEKIVAVKLDVERQQVVAEQAVQDLLRPWTDAKRLRIRPRNVPELTDDDDRGARP